MRRWCSSEGYLCWLSFFRYRQIEEEQNLYWYLSPYSSSPCRQPLRTSITTCRQSQLLRWRTKRSGKQGETAKLWHRVIIIFFCSLINAIIGCQQGILIFDVVARIVRGYDQRACSAIWVQPLSKTDSTWLQFHVMDLKPWKLVLGHIWSWQSFTTNLWNFSHHWKFAWQNHWCSTQLWVFS